MKTPTPIALEHLHVVQLGSDDSVFRDPDATDYVYRQNDYATRLAVAVPGSRMTNLVFTAIPTARKFSSNDRIEFRPVSISSGTTFLRLWRELSKLRRASPIDLLSVQSPCASNWPAILFAWRYSIPLIIQLHFDIFSPHSWKEAFGSGPAAIVKRHLSIRALRLGALVRTVASSTEQQIRDQGLNDHVGTIPVAVPMRGPNSSAEPSSPGSNSQPQRILFVGRLVYPKNLPLWLQTCAIIAQQRPLVQFDIVGQGEEMDELQRLASELNLRDRVHFHGFVPYDELHRFYSAATVFLLTSRYEGFGRVLIEAALFGVPIVSTKVTGPQDIIEDGQTGFLCPPDDAHAIAQRVITLLDDEALREKIGQQARIRLQNMFDPADLAQQWVDAIVSTRAAWIARKQQPPPR